jgi:hypothetical protein
MAVTVTVQRPRAGVVLSFPAGGATPPCAESVKIDGSGETTGVWGGQAYEIEENATTCRFESGPRCWERLEVEWFDAGERLHELDQCCSDADATEARDSAPRVSVTLSTARLGVLLLVFLASAVATVALALACASLAA